MKKLVVWCVLYMLSGFLMEVSGQKNTQLIKGTILDQQTQQVLIGATIYASGLEKGTTTDLDGKFQINGVPTGQYSLKVSYLGYDQVYIPVEIVASQKVVDLMIELTESVNQLTEVVVTSVKDKRRANNELATVSSRQFVIKETNRFAGGLAGPSRKLQNFAGVAGAGGGRNDIIIRGNAPAGLLWRFEGLDIPSPNHFSNSGSNGGLVSILSMNVLANADFYTSAFPAEYGNALAGVFDMNLRTGSTNRQKSLLSVGVLGVNAALEGPISAAKGSTFLLNYRYSTTELLSKLTNGNIGFSGIPIYQDLSFKVNFTMKKGGDLSLFGMGGKSTYLVKATERQEGDFDSQLAGPGNFSFQSDMGVVGMAYKKALGKNIFWQTVVGISGNRENNQVDSISTQNEVLIPLQVNKNRFTRLQLHSFLKKKWTPKVQSKTGISLMRQQFSIRESIVSPTGKGFLDLQNGEGQTYLAQAYSAWQFKTKDASIFNIGLHYTYFGLNRKHALDWRFGARIPVSDYQSKTHLTLGVSTHHQTQQLATYFNQLPIEQMVEPPNIGLGFSKSFHFVIGLEHNFSEQWYMKVEGYLQNLSAIPTHPRGVNSTFSIINEGGDFGNAYETNLVNAGLGRNYGVELTLEKFFSKGYYFLCAGSLYRSEYRTGNGAWYSTKFDGIYNLNVLSGKTFTLKKQRQISLDLKSAWAGGQRFTPIDVAQSRNLGQAIPNRQATFAAQHKSYFRLDAKVTYRVSRPKVTHEFYINVDNIFNTENVFGQYFNDTTLTLETIAQPGQFPSFNYGVNF